MKKLIIILLMGVVVVFAGAVVFAQDEHEGHQHGMVEEEQVEVAGEQEGIAEVGPIEVGNKICPVSGEEIKEGEVYKFEHEGKIYNFCCSMCVKDFKKDPQKYIDILEKDEEKGSHNDREEH